MKTSNEFIAAQCDQAGEVIELVQPVKPVAYITGDRRMLVFADKVDLPTTMTPLYAEAIVQPVQPTPVEWQPRCGSEWRRIDPPKGETLESRVSYLRGLTQQNGKPAYEILALGVIAQTVQPATDSCSYFCERPERIKSQRDDLRAGIATLQTTKGKNMTRSGQIKRFGNIHEDFNGKIVITHFDFEFDAMAMSHAQAALTLIIERLQLELDEVNRAAQPFVYTPEKQPDDLDAEHF